MKHFIRYARSLAMIILALSLLAGAPAAAFPVDAGVSEAEWEVIRLANDYRIKNGVRPLSAFMPLTKVARLRATEVGEVFGHDRPGGSRFATVYDDVGLRYDRAGENIGSGQRTPLRIVNAWIASEAHERVLIRDYYYHMGVGYMTGGSYSPTWAQELFSDNCSTESMTVTGTRVYCRVGSGIAEAGGCVEVMCSEHGLCHMPISTEMCAGFDTSKPGDISVTVTVEGFEASFNITVIDSVQLPALDSRGAPIGEASEMPFTDVREEDFYCRDVLWLYELGIMDGVGGGRFDPEGVISRAMAAKLLFELSGAPRVVGESGFSDVSANDWFAPAVTWASRYGIVNGVGDGLFDPEGLVTREQLAAMLHRLAGFPYLAEREWDAELSDTRQISSWARPAVAWVSGSGIMNAGVDMAFSPKGTVTRAQCAMMLAAYLTR